jgi:hypothetical protein
VTDQENLRLYAIVRDDVRSLVEDSGKPSAQAMHAQSASMRRVFCRKQWGDVWADRYGQWLDQCGGDFGTVTVLKAPFSDIETMTKNCTGFPNGMIHDPTFPIMDGEVGTTMPLDTCAWAFGDKDHLSPILGHLPLL